MKKITLMLLFMSVVSFAQTQEKPYLPAKPVTTEKEYNFLTKGLKDQLEKGLDIIAGYEFEDLRKFKVANYSYDFKYLKEKNTNQRKAISVIIESKVSNTKYYVCIPVRNADLSNSYASFVNQFNPDMSKSFAIALGIISADALIF